jgi:hypothetical protein
MAADALLERIRTSADAYLDVGHSHWPGASHFALVSLDADGCLTGELLIVCRACVRDAARAVICRLDQVATESCRGNVPYLDLIGQSDSAEAACSQCGETA